MRNEIFCLFLSFYVVLFFCIGDSVYNCKEYFFREEVIIFFDMNQVNYFDEYYIFRGFFY